MEWLQPPDQVAADEYAKRLVDSENAFLSEITLRKAETIRELEVSSERVQTTIESALVTANAHVSTVESLSNSRIALLDDLDTLSSRFVSHSDAPSILDGLDNLNRRLNDLDNLKSYLRVIERTLALSESAVNQLTSSTRGTATSVNRSTLSDYVSLLSYIDEVQTLCASIDSTGELPQSLALIAFLRDIQSKTWGDMRTLLSSILLTAAEKIRWPMTIDYGSLPSEDRVQFELCFLNLLKFQELGKLLHANFTAVDQKKEEGLFPLQTLLIPIAQRFKFHFESKRPTNRIDKPEWYFTHILNLIHEHRPFMAGVIQHLLSSTSYKSIVAQDEFIRLLLAIPARKFRNSILQLFSPDPSSSGERKPMMALIAHSIYQALAFDSRIKEGGFNITRTAVNATEKDEKEQWGVSWEVLGRPEWFQAWIRGESEFAQKQYLEIISAADAWALTSASTSDENSSRQLEPNRASQLRPTTSARRLVSLLRSTAERYILLPPSHQISFVLGILLSLLQSYHDRIRGSLDAFETLSGIFGRAVPGSLAGIQGGGTKSGDGKSGGDKLTSGIDGVGKLVKAVLSARYISGYLRSCQDDLVYIELWTFVRSSPTTVTSHHLLPKDRSADTLFVSIVNAYDLLIARAEEMIVRQVSGEVEEALKEYFTGQWDLMSPGSQTDVELDDPPLMLYPALQTLISHLTSLQLAFPLTIFIPLYRAIATRITDVFITRAPVLQRQRVPRTSLTAGRRFAKDVNIWTSRCRSALSTDSGGRRSWKRLEEIAFIVELDESNFEECCSIIFGTRLGKWEVWKKEHGIDVLDIETVKTTLRVREGCPF